MNTGAVLFANNASSRLKIATDAGSPTLTLEDGRGAKFPQPAGDGSNWFMVTVEDRRTGQVEIMKCTQRVNDILTVTRAQEDTIAQDFLQYASVVNRMTAGMMATFFEFNGYSMSEADDRFLNAAGDEMFGPLLLPPGPPTDPEEAANKQYVDDVSIDEAPTDGRAYARSMENWTPVGTGLAEAPADGKLYGRGDLDWHETVPIATFTTFSDDTNAAIAALAGRMTDAETANGAQDSAIADIQAKNTAQDNAIAALQTADGDLSLAITELDGRLDTVETVNDDQDARLDAGVAKDTEQDGRLTAVEGVNTTQDGRLTAVEGVNTAQNGRLDAVEAKNTAQDAAIATKLGDAPSDGLVYGRKNAAWATVIGGAHTDDNPPAGPLQDGQLWWQSSSGNTYIWYVDITGGQWVQINAAAPVAAITRIVRTVVTTSGPFTFSPGCKYAEVDVQAGGGGGGTSTTGTSQASAGGGGAAGGWCRKMFSTSGLTGGTIVIGAAGVSGGAGGASSWTDAVNTLSAAGGNAGQNGSASSAGLGLTGGSGGTASGGDFNVTGDNGGWGLSLGPASFTISWALARGGSGGNSRWGTGGLAIGGGGATSTAGPGGAAGGRGAGGGGAFSSFNGAGNVGGLGGAGQAVVTEYI